MYVIFGMVELKGTEVFNSVAVIGPKGFVTSYQKIHPAGVEVHWAAKGSKACVFETPWGLVGLSICYDVYSFQELTRYARAKGARLFINCTACGRNPVQTDEDVEYSRFYLTRTVEYITATNGMYLASSNLVGLDKTTDFYGNSSIIGPADAYGSVVYYAGHPFTETTEGHKNDVYTTTIDLSMVDRSKLAKLYNTNVKTGAPDYRPEVYKLMYEDLLKEEIFKSKLS